jgi:transposase-like protein
MAPPIYPESTRNDIVARAKAGATFHALSKETGIGIQTIRRWYRDAGGEKRTRLSPHTEATRIAAVEAVRNGASLYSVAKQYQMSHSLLYYWCKQAGVSSRYGFPRTAERLDAASQLQQDSPV